MTKLTINRGLIAESGRIPDGLRLIQDVCRFEPIDVKAAVRESADGREEPITRVAGVFQEGDATNANGRVYGTSEVLVPAVRGIQEDVAARAVPGEYDHPIDAKIHLDRLSHLITKVWMEGRKVYGEAEVLHHLPHGAMLRGLFKHRMRTGISSRGVGDMEVMESRDGQETYRVMPGYAFVTWDVVAEPSVKSAILSIKESVQGRFKQPQERSKTKLLFRKELYENMLVEEINRMFGLPSKKR